jgi:hypothetical protein
MPARKPNGLNRIVKKAKTISAWERVALGLIIITLLSKFQFQHISDIPNKFVLSVLFNLLFECNQKLDIYCSAHVTRFWNNHRQVFSCLGPVVYLLSKLLKLFGFPTFQPWASPHEGYSANLSTLSVPHEGYSANLSTLSVPHEGYSANLSTLSVTSWRLFSQPFTLERTSWRLFSQPFNLERTSWRLFSQPFKLERTLWRLFSQPFNLERTSWRLFRKRVVRTKFDIYVFIHRKTMKMYANCVDALSLEAHELNII